MNRIFNITEEEYLKRHFHPTANSVEFVSAVMLQKIYITIYQNPNLSMTTNPVYKPEYNRLWRKLSNNGLGAYIKKYGEYNFEDSYQGSYHWFFKLNGDIFCLNINLYEGIYLEIEVDNDDEFYNGKHDTGQKLIKFLIELDKYNFINEKIKRIFNEM
jgi:Ni,Fe-hydrogenase I cytochrome b subunit